MLSRFQLDLGEFLGGSNDLVSLRLGPGKRVLAFTRSTVNHLLVTLPAAAHQDIDLVVYQLLCNGTWAAGALLVLGTIFHVGGALAAPAVYVRPQYGRRRIRDLSRRDVAGAVAHFLCKFKNGLGRLVGFRCGRDDTIAGLLSPYPGRATRRRVGHIVRQRWVVFAKSIRSHSAGEGQRVHS